MGTVGKGFLVLQSSQVWWWGWLVDWQVSQSQGLVEVVVVTGNLISVVCSQWSKSCLHFTCAVFKFFGLAPYF